MRKLVSFACGSLLALVACSSPPPPPPPPPTPPAPPKVEAPPPPKEEAKADAPPPFVYAYNPSGKRDPFHNPIDDLTQGEQRQPIEAIKCNQPLCRWDLDQLKLVAIVTGMSSPVAMVEDPGGVGHLVRRNTFMGKKGGRVTQIKRDEVTVTEIYRGSDNKPHATQIPLHLAADANVAEAVNLLENDSGE